MVWIRSVRFRTSETTKGEKALQGEEGEAPHLHSWGCFEREWILIRSFFVYVRFHSPYISSRIRDKFS